MVCQVSCVQYHRNRHMSGQFQLQHVAHQLTSQIMTKMYKDIQAAAAGIATKLAALEHVQDDGRHNT